MRTHLVLIASALAVCVAGAASSAPVDSATYQLAQHPRCYASDGTVYVAGATAVEGTGDAIEGARVRLTIGNSTVMSTPTTSDGRYFASAKIRDASTASVREVATYLVAETGSLIRPAAAMSFGGTCRVTTASVGKLQQVR